MGRYLEKIRLLEQGLTQLGGCPSTPSGHGPAGTPGDYEINEKNEISPAALGADQRLRQALADKQHELALRRRDLASPYYQGDHWVLEQIAHLESHIAEITRYLKEGGELALPRCCRQAEYICLIATRGFDECVMSPIECGYSLRLIGGNEG